MLSQIRHLILDMDGVLWRGDTPMPGLPDFFHGLDELGIRAALATNNASKTPQQYIEKFARFGVTIRSDQIMSSALATAAFLGQTLSPGSPVYVIGDRGLVEALEKAGLTILPRFEQQSSAAAVAVGFNRQVTYDDFAAATYQIRTHNAQFIGCNPDTTFPSENGLMPGNGSLLALVQAATGVEPIIIGKPFPRMFTACLDQFGPQADGQNTAVVGDRLNTDILGGRRAGLKTILVLSGVTQKSDAADSEVQPDLIFDDISSLLEGLQSVVGSTPTPDTAKG